MKKILLLISVFAVGTSSAQWTAQPTGFTAASRGLDEIHIVDANTVWASAYDGSGAAATVQEFTKTANGGVTWTAGIIDIGYPTWPINNISAVSATTAWVSALDSAGTTSTPGGVWKTTDGGDTWVQQIFPNPGFTDAASFIDGCHFFNENIGIAYGDPVGTEMEIYRTTDGGTTWVAIAPAALPNPASGEYFYNSRPIVAGSSMWLPTNKGKVYRTTDMGVTWTKLNSPISDFGAAAINGRLLFSDASNGLLLSTINSGTNYNLYTTTNGGTTWTGPVAYTSYNRILSYIPGTSTVVATGANVTAPSTGGSSYSNDRGVTWTSIETSSATIQRGANAFLTPALGWCAGFSSATGGIFKYTGPVLANADFNTNTANFTVYPNPSNGIFKIASPTVNVNQVVVFDILGKEVYSNNFDATSEVSVDLTNLNAGAYFMKVVSVEGGIQTIKVIKN